jgi:hypothetical protein
MWALSQTGVALTARVPTSTLLFVLSATCVGQRGPPRLDVVRRLQAVRGFQYLTTRPRVRRKCKAIGRVLTKLVPTSTMPSAHNVIAAVLLALRRKRKAIGRVLTKLVPTSTLPNARSVIAAALPALPLPTPVADL